MSVLVLVRHGQSQWNLENRFAGWTDVPLTPQGEKDAALCAEHLKDMYFALAFTSKLQRAATTLDILLRELHQENIPVVAHEALNERSYGDLTGLNKAEIAAKFGQQQVQLWRRSYSTRPPNGESIEDCEHRVLPFFLEYVMPLIRQGKNILIAAHGNSMRPIIKYLERLDPETTASMEIGLCTPYIYWFEEEKVVKKEVRAIPGIVTMGASMTEKIVEKGRVGTPSDSRSL